MRFEWDRNKSRSNRRKHGVTFETASFVFEDPNQLSIQDRFEGREERWQTMGLVNGLAVLIVAPPLGMTAEKKSFALFRRARRRRERGSDTMKAPDKAAAELSALADLPDSEIDTSDIPERADWADAVRGKFHRGDAPSRNAGSVRRMSDEQKAEIQRLLLQGMGRYDVAAQVGATPGQVSAIKAWLTMRSPSVVTANTEGDELVEAVETTFGLERDLQQALRSNIVQLEPGLTIVDGGRERSVKSGGRIDILAKDRSGATVVIELKAGRADRDAVGQILGYIGELMGEATPIRGILVAAEFSPRTIAAARAAPNIRLVSYGIQFLFNPIDAHAV